MNGASDCHPNAPRTLFLFLLVLQFHHVQRDHISNQSSKSADCTKYVMINAHFYNIFFLYKFSATLLASS